MAWYQVINTHRDPYVADRDAETLLHQVAAALRGANASGAAAVYYGRTPTGARIYYFSLSPAAFALAQDALAAYELTPLADAPDLRGTEHVKRL